MKKARVFIKDIGYVVKLFRLRPFDTISENSRSQERNRRILITAISSTLAKIVTIATSLVTVPITLNYLGNERYGLWMTISSIIAMMVFADFGIGNGLMNAISDSYGRNDIEGIRKHISNALFILIIMAIAIISVFFIFYHIINWGKFFNVKSVIANIEAGPSIAAFVVCFALGIPIGIVHRIQLGMQKGYICGIWQSIGSIFGLIMVLTIIHFRGKLIWLIIGIAGAPLIAYVINGYQLFFISNREILPNIRYVSISGIKRIFKTGLLFFALQIGVSIAYVSDNVIIARVLGAEKVADYSIVSKMFEGAIMVIGLAFTPLWPAYGEAKARKDRNWIRNILSKSMAYTLLIFVSVAVVLVILNKQIFSIWVGSKNVIPKALVIWYAIWMIIKGLGNTYSMFLNGMHIIRFQLIIVSIFVVTSITLKIILIKHIGVQGIIIALIISYGIFVSIPYLFITQKILNDKNVE